MTRRWQTVIVGFGQAADSLGDDPLMAKHFEFSSHAQVLARHPAFDWAAVVDPSGGALKRAATKWDIRHVAKDAAALRGAFAPEVAVITAPAAARPAVVEALPSLKAVLVEKPLGPAPADALRLVEVCRRRDVLVQVNYWRRAARGFRDLADGGLAALVGRRQAVFATYGNGLFNNGSHLVDTVRLLLGEVTEARAVAPLSPLAGAPIPGDVQVPFVLKVEDGATVMAQPLDFERYREAGLDIWGEAGRLSILQEGLVASHHPVRPNRALAEAREVASDRPRPVPFPLSRAFYDIYDDLAAALDRGAPLCSSGRSALVTEAVLQGIRRSADGGGVAVRFEDGRAVDQP